MSSATADLNAPNSPTALPAVRCSDGLERRDRTRKIKRDWMRRWRIENPEAAKAAIEKAKGKYQEAHRRANMAWRKRNPEKHRAYNLALERKWRNGLETPYVKYQMSRGTSVPSNHWPADLVEAKKAQMKLRRLCRKSRTTTN